MSNKMVAVPGQRIIYTGTYGGSIVGSLVGPGSSPSSAPTATLSGGSGVDSGAHSYAVTFTTAAGESIVGPLATITTGTVTAPTTAPTVGTPTAGAGPDNGNHDYQVTFTTAAGETTPSPATTTVTVNSPSAVSVPSTPSAALSNVVGNLPQGNHVYKVTYGTALGETTGSTQSSNVSVVAVSNPGSVPSVTAHGGAGNLNGDYSYYVTFVTAAGETRAPLLAAYNSGYVVGTVELTDLPTTTDVRVTARRIYRDLNGDLSYFRVATIDTTVTSYTDNVAAASLGPAMPTSNTCTDGLQASLTIPTSADARVTKRKVYRDDGSGFYLVGTVNDNTTTTYTDNTASLGAAIPSVNDAAGAAYHTVALTAVPLGSSIVTGRKIYRRFNGAGTYKLAGTISDNTTTTFSDTVTNASLGADAPSSNTATANQVALSAIPKGAASVTGRKLYRTTVGGSTLKLLATIADNTTTTYTDSTADASLGATAPSTDTSGLAQPTGQVLAGSTSLLVADASWARSAGGWAVIGNGQQVIRYTGVSGSTLTGIPATGPGAITSSITYGSSVTGAPMLTGIPASGEGSITATITKGEQVNLLVQVDDAAAQAVLAALIGGDGVQEDYRQDGRITETEARARATARLALQNDVQVSIAYAVRDPETKAGRTINVDLPAPTSVTGEFKIQRVTISGFSASRDLFPTFTAEASSVRFTFEDLLRQLGR